MPCLLLFALYTMLYAFIELNSFSPFNLRNLRMMFCCCLSSAICRLMLDHIRKHLLHPPEIEEPAHQQQKDNEGRDAEKTPVNGLMPQN